MSPLENIKRS